MRAAWELLACSVRGCARPLQREDRALRCASGHAFDVARAGHVNLLQPQDRRSLAAGDSLQVVRARLALEERGVGAAMDAALAELLGEFLTRARPRPAAAAQLTALDLGCGTGGRLARLAARCDLAGLGLDLSAAAVELAARRHPALAWCVANCDRVLPVRSAAVDLVLSVDARRPAAEIERVLAPGGVLLVALPGPSDLVELRAAVLADARPLAGLSRAEAELSAAFELSARRRVCEHHELDCAGMRDLARATYRAGRRGEAARLEALASLRVTVDHELGLFRRRAG
ncbi:MAG: methyltransferase domain-containing protein [Planctomycetes bacterium]|nr:methyltransferase domain-containing protein [Planctomycetota bacterium]